MRSGELKFQAISLPLETPGRTDGDATHAFELPAARIGGPEPANATSAVTVSVTAQPAIPDPAAASLTASDTVKIHSARPMAESSSLVAAHASVTGGN